MAFDNLCSCHSDPFETIPTSFSTDSRKSYFDDTIVRSDPKVDRSPTKISSTRWEALREVVASHGDYTVQDYCDLYDKPVESMLPIEETKEDLTTDNADSIYPTKESKTKNTRSLMDDEDDDDEMQISEDDDIREKPCDQDLHTCESFDHYIGKPSKRFLCASPSTPTGATFRVPLSPPTARLPDRRRSRQISAAQISPRTLNFQMSYNGQRLTPPSPAPSAADTYSTISLSQSFAREFDEDDDFQAFEPAGGNLFLDRLAAETISQSPSRSPFRKLRPRTRLEDEKKEEEERPSTPTRKRRTEEDNDEQYRCLVRMSPDNYKHGKTSSDWFEEFPKPETTSCASSISSSVLLPLHPHQRIMEPLSDMEQSGYSFFRDHPHSIKRRITVG